VPETLTVLLRVCEAEEDPVEVTEDVNDLTAEDVNVELSVVLIVVDAVVVPDSEIDDVAVELSVDDGDVTSQPKNVPSSCLFTRSLSAAANDRQSVCEEPRISKIRAL
jgi:hypothetical protein